MQVFIKAICHLCAENIAAAAQRRIFDDIVTIPMKKFSARTKREYERRKSEMNMDYTSVDPIVRQWN